MGKLMQTRMQTLIATLRGGLAVLAGTVAMLAAGAAQAQQVLLAVDSRANRVFTASPFDGAILNPAFIVDANDPGSFDFVTPRAAIQVNNEIWVSDQSPSINAIFRFDLSGQYVGTIGGAAGGLSNVRGMRLIDGTVHVANAGGTSTVRGYGTIDPLGLGDNTNYTLIQGLVSGGWISVAVIPEPGTWALMGAGVLLLGWRVRRREAQATA